MTYQTSQNFIRIMNLLVTLYSIKVGFLSICRITAGCHSNNQLLFTAFCLLSVGWIKANGESSLPILFCPLTVKSFIHEKKGKSISAVGLKKPKVFFDFFPNYFYFFKSFLVILSRFNYICLQRGYK